MKSQKKFIIIFGINNIENDYYTVCKNSSTLC